MDVYVGVLLGCLGPWAAWPLLDRVEVELRQRLHEWQVERVR